MAYPDYSILGARASRDIAGATLSASGLIAQHSSVVQAALDRARRLGISLSAPVLPRADRAVAAASRAGTTGAPAGSAAPAKAGAPGGSTRFDDLIRSAATREGIDPALVRAVTQAESAFNPNAVSPAGAKGLMQLMDGTARSLGVTNSFDPAQNIAAGAKYLKQLLSKYGGNAKRAVAAYNAGPGAVDEFGGVPPYQETQTYVQQVLRLRDAYSTTGTNGTTRSAGAATAGGVTPAAGRSQAPAAKS